MFKKKYYVEINPERLTSLFIRYIDKPPPKLQRHEEKILQKYSKAFKSAYWSYSTLSNGKCILNSLILNTILTIAGEIFGRTITAGDFPAKSDSEYLGDCPC